jgi:hypothetical protein
MSQVNLKNPNNLISFKANNIHLTLKVSRKGLDVLISLGIREKSGMLLSSSSTPPNFLED